MQFNKDKIKVFKKITKNFVLAGTMAAVIVSSPMFKTNANAALNTDEILPDKTGYYELSDDESYLYANGNVDIDFATNIDTLDEIYIENTVINNDIILNNNVSKLVINNCKFENLSIISAQNLKSIEFINCDFNDLSSLSNLNNITTLSFESCNIGSLKGIENLSLISELSFTDVGIENINYLNSLKYLTKLKLNGTYVKNIDVLTNLNIKDLDISNSLNIESLEPILSMKYLKYFYATNCQMLLDDNIINYISQNNIYTDITKEDLEIKYEVKKIANSIINDSMSEEEKIYRITNYVVDSIEYDSNIEYDSDLELEYNNNALKYALQGTGCCKNYSVFTKALLNEADIKAFEMQGDNHVWTLIELNGKYYWIDSTWIDNLDYENIKDCEYYMISTKEFLNHENSSIPSSMYNKLHNLNYEENIDRNDNITTTAKHETKINENIIKNLKFKKASIGATVGIAMALSSAFLIGRKKQVKKNKSYK